MVCVYNKLTHLEQNEIDGYDYYDRLFQEQFVFLIIDYHNNTYELFENYDDLTNCEYEFDDYRILKLSDVCYKQFLQNKYSIDISDYTKE